MDRSKVRERIRALREMTRGRGCTEAEAMAAAAKAAELMQKAGLSEADIEVGESEVPSKGRGNAIVARLWPVISYCTNTSAIVLQDHDSNSVMFIGREPGPDIAAYLWSICERAVEREVRIFKTGSFFRRRRSLATKRQAIQDFKAGMIDRLRARLSQLFEPVINDSDRELALAARDERFPNSKSLINRKRKQRFSDAAWKGWEAGNTVPLNHGVGAADKPQLLS